MNIELARLLFRWFYNRKIVSKKRVGLIKIGFTSLNLDNIPSRESVSHFTTGSGIPGIFCFP